MLTLPHAELLKQEREQFGDKHKKEESVQAEAEMQWSLQESASQYTFEPMQVSDALH